MKQWMTWHQAVLLGACIGIVAWLFSPNYQTCDDNNHKQPNQEKKTYIKVIGTNVGIFLKDPNHSAAIQALSGTASAFFALVLIVVSNRQAKLTEAANMTAERALTVVQRAYVVLSSAGVSGNPARHALKPVSIGSTPYAYVFFKNIGNTPAYNFISYARIGIFDWPLKPEVLPPIEFDRPRNVRQTIAPNANHSTAFENELPALTHADLNGLTQGTKAIFLYGEARYLDAFNAARWIKFRYFYGGDIYSRLDTWEMNAHEEGNEAN